MKSTLTPLQRAADAAREAHEKTRKELLKADQAWNDAARKLNGADWRKLIDTIPDPKLRKKIAKLVWWDYFGGREVSEAWHDLDEYIAEEVRKEGDPPEPQFTPATVTHALMDLGYPRFKAEGRLNQGER